MGEWKGQKGGGGGLKIVTRISVVFRDEKDGSRFEDKRKGEKYMLLRR